MAEPFRLLFADAAPPLVGRLVTVTVNGEDVRGRITGHDSAGFLVTPVSDGVTE